MQHVSLPEVHVGCKIATAFRSSKCSFAHGQAYAAVVVPCLRLCQIKVTFMFTVARLQICLPCVAVGAEPAVPRHEVLSSIRSIAPLVASIGPAFEALALRKNAALPAFQFLVGGEGSDYYRWQIRALKAAEKDSTGLAIGQRTRPLSVGERGLLLGEVAAVGAHSAAQTAPKPATVTDIAGDSSVVSKQYLAFLRSED